MRDPGKRRDATVTGRPVRGKRGDMKTEYKGGSLNLVRRQRAWYRLRLGRLLLEDERARLADILPDLFGYHLLQVSHPADADLLAASRIPHRVVLDADTAGMLTVTPGVYARPDSLPIASDSIDVLVLPHTLEFEPDPHQVLREAERVVIAEGAIVIIGFNPWSLWGLWRLFLWRSSDPPWRGRFLGLTRVRDWLALLGFDEVRTQPYFFRPPLHHAGIMHRLSFLERLGARWWPRCAGAYILVARKRVSTLTPIRPRWSTPPRRMAGLVEPSARSMHHDEEQ